MSSDSAHVIESEFRHGHVFAERYRILEKLASNSVTAVYRALDQSANQPIALKLIRAAAIERQRDAFTRYRLDLNSMRQIVHANLVRIFELGEYAGHFYLAMELVEGRTLLDHLKQTGRLPTGEFFKFLFELCEAVGELHTHDVIHRAIHPGNVMLTASGNLKLMDFGVDRDGRHGAQPNALSYLAPEQMASRKRAAETLVHPAATMDVFAIGAVCYTALTGKKPAQSANFAAYAQADFRDIPPVLVPLLEKCLQQDPDKRYRSIGALLGSASALRDASAAGSSRLRLDHFGREGPGEPDTCTRLFLKIVTRLREMHAGGLYHAELSPEKIWLIDGAVEIERSAPAAGQGTLLIPDAKYSAPELLMAQTAPDEASHVAADIYVLGFVLYEMLVGRAGMKNQFPENDSTRSGLGWMRWHVEPDQKLQPLAKLIVSCPDALSDLVEGMVEKNPSKRIRSLDEVEARLKSLRARLDQTDQFEPCPTRPVVVTRPARRRARSVVTSLTLVAIVAGGVWWAARAGWGSLLAAKFSNLKLSLTKKALPAEAANRGPSPPAPPTLPQIARTATGVMLLIPEGEFVMGDDALPIAAPAHKMYLPAFYIDRVEVSNFEYQKFCRKPGRACSPEPTWDSRYSAKSELPAINVTWGEARAFCEASGKRLPSEPEWEKAARGTEAFIHWANWSLPGISNLKSTTSRSRPAPVGSFAGDVSPYGVLDLAGNVQEWVNDSYHPYGKTFTSSNGGEGAKLIRGGSYAMSADGLSPAWRMWSSDSSAAFRSPSVGFRCSADPSRLQPLSNH